MTNYAMTEVVDYFWDIVLANDCQAERLNTTNVENT